MEKAVVGDALATFYDQDGQAVETSLSQRMVGISLEELAMMNEDAILVARRSGREIEMQDLEEAITRVIAGPEKRSRVITEKDKKLVAYHEAGHATVSC